MKKIILIILLLISFNAYSQWDKIVVKDSAKIGTGWFKGINGTNTWTGTNYFSNIYSRTLNTDTLNVNVVNSNSVLDPVDFAGGKLIQEYNGAFVPVSINELFDSTEIEYASIWNIHANYLFLDVIQSTLQPGLPSSSFDIGSSWINIATNDSLIMAMEDSKITTKNILPYYNNRYTLGVDGIQWKALYTGNVILGTSSVEVAGSIKYLSGHFYGYDGNIWKQLDN